MLFGKYDSLLAVVVMLVVKLLVVIMLVVMMLVVIMLVVVMLVVIMMVVIMMVVIMLVVIMMKYDGFPLFTFVRAREPQMCRHDLLLHSNAFSLHRCGRGNS